jgi:uncharacterized protein YigE (DUF2233 family)
MKHNRIRAVWLITLASFMPAFASALECKRIALNDTVTHASLCNVDLRTDHLQLFLNDAAGRPLNTFQRLGDTLQGQGRRLLFAMNAGMYRQDFSPLGLFVVDGQALHRLNLASGYGNFYLKPNGVFLVSATGAHLVASTEYNSIQEPMRLATQSGPMLVQHGAINSLFDPHGTSKFVRNGVGVVSSQEVVFAITDEPVNFYTFALLFRDQLHCADALYLDGDISSLYAAELQRDDERARIGPIIAVTAPAH